MSFAASLNRACQVAIVETVAQAKRVVTTLSEAIINDTPVLTGRLKGGWKASQNAPILGAGVRLDPMGTATLAEMRAVVAGLSERKDWVFYLANSTKYGPAIEFNGRSAKAPNGMVRINMSKIAQHVRNAIAGL